MKKNEQKDEQGFKSLHHQDTRVRTAGQSIYIRNAAHEKSVGLKWVQTAFTKATQGAVRALTRGQ